MTWSGRRDSNPRPSPWQFDPGPVLTRAETHNCRSVGPHRPSLSTLCDAILCPSGTYMARRARRNIVVRTSFWGLSGHRCSTSRTIPSGFVASSLWPCSEGRTPPQALRSSLRRVPRTGLLSSITFGWSVAAGTPQASSGAVVRRLIRVSDALVLLAGTPFSYHQVHVPHRQHPPQPGGPPLVG